MHHLSWWGPLSLRNIFHCSLFYRTLNCFLCFFSSTKFDELEVIVVFQPFPERHLSARFSSRSQHLGYHVWQSPFVPNPHMHTQFLCTILMLPLRGDNIRVTLEDPPKMKRLAYVTARVLCAQLCTHHIAPRQNVHNQFANSKTDARSIFWRRRTERRIRRREGGRDRETMTLMSRYILGAGIEAAGSYL